MLISCRKYNDCRLPASMCNSNCPEKDVPLEKPVGMQGPVCDRLFECNGWKKSYRQLNDAILKLRLSSNKPCPIVPFKFCPWCGKEIKWDEWDRRITGQTKEEVKGND